MKIKYIDTSIQPPLLALPGQQTREPLDLVAPDWQLFGLIVAHGPDIVSDLALQHTKLRALLAITFRTRGELQLCGLKVARLHLHTTHLR
jgi:hypothetical protein